MEPKQRKGASLGGGLQGQREIFGVQKKRHPLRPQLVHGG